VCACWLQKLDITWQVHATHTNSQALLLLLLLLLGSVASWLQQQPLFYNMQQLVHGVPEPSVLDSYLLVLGNPLLQLRVVQYKIWKVRRLAPLVQFSRLLCICCVTGGLQVPHTAHGQRVCTASNR
jgi:uncharacterized membrane protein